LIARVGLLRFGVHDLTTGFKLTKVKGVLDKVDLDHLYSNSFAYKLHILAACLNNGAKVVEVPITFMARTAGESKIIKNEMIESLKVIFLFQIHNPKILRFFKFATVGFIGYLINAFGLEIFYRLGLATAIAAALGAELAIISNFTLNNFWTFSERKITSVGRLIVKFLQFNFTSLGAILIQAVVVGTGTRIFGNQYRQIMLIVAVGFFVLPYNYAAYNILIWKTWKIPGLGWLQKLVG
jgi:dolichol-phosphate mannosyltransferase